MTKPITQTNTGYGILASDDKFWSSRCFPSEWDAKSFLREKIFYQDSHKYKIVKVQSTITVIEE